MEILSALQRYSLYFLIVRALLLVGEGIFLLYRKGTKSDVLSNAGCGVLLLLFYRYVAGGVALGAMLYLASFAEQPLEITWGLFFLTLLCADLSFYIYHRAAHGIRLLWADHSVHHTSRELDFSTNLRNPLFSGLYSWLPLTPLLLLGVNPILVAACQAFVNEYPFLLHTRHVGKLGPGIEFLFNTPSHHRVHHAYDRQYVNKNFGGILIIWDRLFGTFAKEQAPCSFGTAETVASKNPLRIVFHEWGRMFADLLRSQGWKQRAAALLRTGNRT